MIITLMLIAGMAGNRTKSGEYGKIWTQGANPTSAVETILRDIRGQFCGKEGTTSTWFPEIHCDPDTSSGSLCVKAGLGSGLFWEKRFAAYGLPCVPGGIYDCLLA